VVLVRRSGGGFFDGSTLDESVEPVIVLRRVLIDGRERFHLLRPIAYRDAPRLRRHREDIDSAVSGGIDDGRRDIGSDEGHRDVFVVPADPESFISDLASVPAVFTWLVPRSGAHLPAALLHDALVAGPEHYEGRPVERLEADRIFRDSMIALGTSTARRWLMWATVVLATIWLGALPHARWYRAVMGVTLASVVVLGVIGTLEVTGLLSWTRWGDGRPLGDRVMIGLATAVGTPVLLSVLWWRLWPVGVITGVALALLLHVTLVLVVLTLGFGVIEAVSSAVEGRLGRWFGATGTGTPGRARSMLPAKR
jgi:hypothetical protein